MIEEKLMTTDEVAAFLQLNRQTITQMASRGQLPGMKIAGEWRFKKEYIDTSLEGELKKKLCS